MLFSWFYSISYRWYTYHRVIHFKITFIAINNTILNNYYSMLSITISRLDSIYNFNISYIFFEFNCSSLLIAFVSGCKTILKVWGVKKFPWIRFGLDYLIKWCNFRISLRKIGSNYLTGTSKIYFAITFLLPG